MYQQDPTILHLKQQNVENQRQIELLMGRVNLLIKQQQLSTSPKKQLEIAYRKKKQHDSLIEELKLAKEATNDPDSVNRKKQSNLISKFQLNQAVKSAKEQVEKDREQQAKQIKKLSSLHQKSIEDQKQQSQKEKASNRNQVQRDQFESKYKYQLYWDERVKRFQQEQKQTKHQLSKSMMDQENLMQFLAKQEINLIGRLQQSKSQSQFLQQQLEDAKRLKSKEWEQIYGKPKDNKFQQIMDIKAK